MRPSIAAIAVAVLLCVAPRAAAQGQTIGASRVSALTATIYARCDPSSPARAALQRGAAVTIEGVNEGWVHVRDDASGERGCMRRADLEPTPAVDRALDAQRTRQIQAARGRAKPVVTTTKHTPWQRVIVSANASYLSASRTFDDSRTFDLNLETARFDASYDVQPSVGADVGVFVRVWRGLAAGVAFTSYIDSRDIELSASLPHPLLFDRPRTIQGTVGGDHEETAAHLQVAYIVPIGKKLEAVVFGGPSFFTVKQSVVTAVRFSETYPYDEASFTTADVETEEANKTGFNVGADVAYYFTRNVGVGGIIRFSAAKTTFSLGDVDAGGALVGGGVRLRF
jgi:hypothetical protein